MLFTGVRGIRELNRVHTSRFSSFLGVFNGIDLYLRNGEVWQIHEGILNLRAFRSLACGAWNARLGMVKDRTSSKFSTEHIGKRQRKVSPVGCNFVIFVGQTLRDNKLDISSRVLATVTGRIVAEGADTRVAVVTSVTTIATARLGTHLIPHLVVRVVEGIVLSRFNVVVFKTATMTTAPVGAASAAATTAPH